MYRVYLGYPMSFQGFAKNTFEIASSCVAKALDYTYYNDTYYNTLLQCNANLDSIAAGMSCYCC